MLKIDRVSEEEGFVVFALTGRIQSEDVQELRKLISAEKQKIALDLKDVNLVGRAGVRFLSKCQGEGIELRNLSRYISDWMSTESTMNDSSADDE